MSFNRLAYDSCEYQQKLEQNVSNIDFILDPIKYEHDQKCRNEFGLLGGTNVSHVKGNLVDLENDLRGQNRPRLALNTLIKVANRGLERKMN